MKQGEGEGVPSRWQLMMSCVSDELAAERRQCCRVARSRKRGRGLGSRCCVQGCGCMFWGAGWGSIESLAREGMWRDEPLPPGPLYMPPRPIHVMFVSLYSVLIKLVEQSNSQL